MKRYRWTLAAALLAALLALGVSGCRNDGGPATDSETDGTGSVTESASTAVASETPTEDPTETTESATTIPEEMTMAPTETLSVIADGKTSYTVLPGAGVTDACRAELDWLYAVMDEKYDLLNHTLSMNIDRIWRRRVVRIVCRSRPHRILDVATGTGDLAIEMARRIRDVHVLGVDLSEKMLDVARCKVAARGLDERVVLDVGDAEHLRVSDASVDVVTVAFGVRHFGDLEAGLGEMARTIKPGGKGVMLEFSRPRNRLLRVLYEFYTYKILPRIGGMVSKDKRAYEYLPASVGEFPAPAEFMSMMERAGFRGCRARSQSFGIAQIYTGQR